MSDATIGYGSEFGIAADDTYANVTPLAEVTNITPPGTTANLVDVTHLKSPGRYREFIKGMLDGGEASLTLNYVPGDADIVLAAVNAPTAGYYEIKYPSGVKLRFKGLFTGWEPGDVEADDKLSLSATVKQTGPATLVAAS